MESIRVLPVTRQTMSLPWQEFVQMLLEDSAAGFVCGDDFHFGHRGEGSAEKLQSFCQEQGLPCIVVPEQTVGSIRISSTYIRRQIETGDMATAVKFMGHPYTLTGTVVHGRKLGRKLGIPTANLHLPDGLAIPRFGVYACCVLIDGVRYPAVTNIGSRPSIDEDNHVPNIETHIIGYHGWLYDRHVTVAFRHRLRDEIRFSALDDLKAQIARGIRASETTFHESK